VGRVEGGGHYLMKRTELWVVICPDLKTIAQVERGEGVGREGEGESQGVD
jgi:hypothetical protein